MININIVRDKEGFIWEYVVKGHAGYAKNGKDIVCAAVTAIACTGVGALEDILGIEGSIVGDGYVKCVLPCDIKNDDKQKAKIILDTIVIGFKQIELSYKKYISVIDEEV